ncbi:TetR/AcrR family transcriptional regulator [Mycolicibacterium goodii]|uniref:TetR/AcrR family transcriptional regulator n=1 Tax=Mycolicibacterium goodii TaxID=134601 RepID=A0ABS6HS20_MYCGD|nr:TetR/AcrR family transcriptional regulator [Mycolicibacterium goodii]MBU8809691.1 TetR/AcrR family transcriptional regulator [Mycolicibacterium goodii]MBU8816246.1 TetR/AcrR family transcriptional regulator [Mycolicibacterium goodii]MBU8824725.1 TetR/AcrR family transcriptional regulator [Mycolicibacterium goodii]MBU8833766.1 TetR/AcrR family transcriptional regulator [Mycolicibacterium goodii]MBU8837311.1 TetR/AcrR family transcriptional regulator [Mycolicibacterium goodii]
MTGPTSRTIVGVPDRQRRRYAPRLPREQRRQQLLDAALTVLADCPLHELSMEAVAEAAGVGKPVLYTAYRTRAELVTALLTREHQRGLDQVRAALPDDLGVAGPTEAYTATVSAFLQAVLENPTRWRLILTVPDSAPREYRAAVRHARSQIVELAESFARAGIELDPRLTNLDPALLGHTMLSFAEMLGRLAVHDPETYPRDRLQEYAATTMKMFAGQFQVAAP